MSNPCKVCALPTEIKREIEGKMVESQSHTAIARLYKHLKISNLNIKNHMKHLSQKLVKNEETKSLLHSSNLLKNIDNLYMRTSRILDNAERKDNPYLSLAACKELRQCNEFLVRLHVHLREIALEEEKKEKHGIDNDLVKKLKGNLTVPELEMLEEILAKASGKKVVLYLPDNNRKDNVAREVVSPEKQFERKENDEKQEDEKGLEAKSEIEQLQEDPEIENEIEEKPIAGNLRRNINYDKMFPGSGINTEYRILKH